MYNNILLFFCLKSWAGHQDIVNLLLTQSNRPANPNLQVNYNDNSIFFLIKYSLDALTMI